MLRRIFLRNPDTGHWRCFDRPEAVLAASNPAEVCDVLSQAQASVDAHGHFAAGFVAYEAAPAFDASFRTGNPPQLPYAVFGLFAGETVLEALPVPAAGGVAANWQLTTGRERHADNIRRIHEQIALGNCYQVNYTIRKQAAGVHDPWQLFLRIARDAPFGAYLEFEDFVVISASPELFFELDGTAIRCRPMKGTARRGMTSAQDAAIADALRHSAKDRAENVMIADMLRNDLGRIAHPGSVRATSLYEIEKYPTVWQMTSTVQAHTDESLPAIFAALFPCASVTGAPKTAAMSVIAGIEDEPRGVYTGAIGCVSPQRKACFSVAIRTAVVDRRTGAGTYGVGGGIVWDSDAAGEYRECQAKARILETIESPGGDFELLETLRWQQGTGYYLREFHLDRLRDSAGYFDLPCDDAAIGAALDRAAAGFPARDMRVRLLLDRAGTPRVEASPLVDLPRPLVRLRLAAGPVDEQNPFLYHKTTRRRVYEDALARAGDCDDVLLWNSAGQVTETTRANVIVRLRGRDYTPPVDCGLLAGTFRRWLLENTELTERTIAVDELHAAEEIVLVNSVRGRLRARLERLDPALPA